MTLARPNCAVRRTSPAPPWVVVRKAHVENQPVVDERAERRHATLLFAVETVAIGAVVFLVLAVITRAVVDLGLWQ